jgi:hypothetical protein
LWHGTQLQGQQIKTELARVKRQLEAERVKIENLSSEKVVSAKALHGGTKRISGLEREMAEAVSELRLQEREVHDLQNAENALNAKLHDRGVGKSASYDYLISTPLDVDFDREYGLLDSLEPNGRRQPRASEQRDDRPNSRSNELIESLEQSVRASREATSQAYEFVRGGESISAGTAQSNALAATAALYSQWSAAGHPQPPIAGLELFPDFAMREGKIAGPIAQEALTKRRLESIEAYGML